MIGTTRTAGVTRKKSVSALAEAVRLLALTVAVVLVSWPFLTANHLGGLDARWYSVVLTDFIEQVRAGVFPIFVGQGSYQFNGAVHPYRFAPYFQYLAGIIDLLTGRTLGIHALQHATVVVTTAGGAFAMYFGLAALASGRRWIAMAVAAMYTMSPAFLGLLAIHDMYMSYMAMAWLPLLVCGLARWAERGPAAAAGVIIAASLSLLWSCHPPVALWATIATASVIAGSWWIHGAHWDHLARSLGVFVLWLGLSAYYFYGILEVAPSGSGAWTEADALGWCIWVGIAAAILVFSRRYWRAVGPGTRAGWLALAVLGGLGGAVAVRMVLGMAESPVAMGTVAYTKNFWPEILRPVSKVPGSRLSDVQPGMAMLVMACSAVVAVVRWTEAKIRLLSIVAAIMACLLLPFSPVTVFLWNLLPTSLHVATSGAVNLRLFPVWVSLVTVIGFCVIARGGERKLSRAALAVGSVVALVWSANEVRKFTRGLGALEMSPAQTILYSRPENSVLFVYSGNFIGTPSYFSNGVRDYRLESRVLDPVTLLPKQELVPATDGSSRSPAREILLEAVAQGAEWNISPTLWLLPDQPLLLQFEFIEPVPDGTLILSATDIYREYTLPSSGAAKSFGSGSENTRELPLWTTAGAPEEISLRVVNVESPAVDSGRRDFARVTLEPITEDRLPVKTLSLVPFFRARVEVTAAAVLETPRTWVPGYRAVRNSRPVDLVRTPEILVGVPLEPGVNEVDLQFVGTVGLWRAFICSLACWWGVAVWSGHRIFVRKISKRS